MTDYNGMLIGLGICGIFFALMYLSGRIFSVSDQEYEKVITEHGEFGLKFLLEQKKKYGGRVPCNNTIFDKLKQSRLEEYYAKKDRKAKAKYDKEFDSKHKDD